MGRTVTATDSRSILDLVVELGAHVKATLGAVDRLNKSQDRTLAAMRRPPAAPVYTDLHDSDTAGAGLLVLALGSPPQGFIWYVRSIAITGNDPTQAPAGKGYVYVMPNTPQNNVTTMGQLGALFFRDVANSFPLPSFYGRGELVIQRNQNLIIAIAGGTNATQYNANATVEQFEEAPAPQVFVQ